MGVDYEVAVDRMIALLTVLGLAAPLSERAAFHERFRRGERNLIIPILHWALEGLLAHKKRVYDARFSLPVTVLAMHVVAPKNLDAYKSVVGAATARRKSAPGRCQKDESKALIRDRADRPWKSPTTGQLPHHSPLSRNEGDPTFKVSQATPSRESARDERSHAPSMTMSTRSTPSRPATRDRWATNRDVGIGPPAPSKSSPGGRERFFDQVIEVGLPEAWDTAKLVELMRVDATEARVKPWLTVAQRWKASAHWLARKAATGIRRRSSTATSDASLQSTRSAQLPPRDCLHATEPGAFSPQLLWTYPRLTSGSLSTSEISTFCFPDGVQLEVSRHDAMRDDRINVFVFHVALDPNTSGDVAEAKDDKAHMPQKHMLYGICHVDRRQCALSGSDGEPASDVVYIPRCFCVLSRLPFIELHCRVLKAAVAFAKQQAAALPSTMSEAEVAVKVRETVRTALSDFRSREVPKPGGELRYTIPALDQTADENPVELVFQRPATLRYAEFLDDVLRKGSAILNASRTRFVDYIPTSMSWTRVDYANLDATADWSVPILLSVVPAQQLVRVLAAVLCELQVVILSKHCAAGAAACLGLAALARPLLWVGPLVPVLPTQLHCILEAPTPYIVATPRTTTWCECIANRLPNPGLVVLDLDSASFCFNPTDADLVELPNADALIEVLQPMLAVLRLNAADSLEVTTCMEKSARVAQKQVARHVTRLCRVAMCFEKRSGANAERNRGQRLTEVAARTRESIEFATIMRQEQRRLEASSANEFESEPPLEAPVSSSATDKPVSTNQALRRSIDHSFLDISSSQHWLRQSSELLRDGNYAYPLRHVFFERIAESQSYTVFRESFPDFQGLTEQERDALSIPTPVIGLASTRHHNSCDATRGGNRPPAPPPKLRLSSADDPMPRRDDDASSVDTYSGQIN